MIHFRDLDPADFRGSVVILDIDGTVVADGEESLAPAEAHVLAALAKEASVYLVASKGHGRLSAIASAYGTEAIVSDALKPSRRLLMGVALPDKPRIVVGDKALTDGWFASRISARFVRVRRLARCDEPLEVTLLYAFDDVLWAFLSVFRMVRASTPWLYVRLARPRQWVKNLLLLAPLFLAGGLFD